MADIHYTIGAKDNASKPMQQVESSMDRLQRSTKRLARVSEESTKKISISFASLAKGAVTMKAADLAVQGLRAAIGSISGVLSSANAAFDVQTEAVKGLETALSLAGEEVTKQSAGLQSFASDLQALTGVGDEVTLGLMRQASMLGVSSDQLDDVARAAVGLAEATGKSLDEALKIATNSIQGEFGALGEVLPALRSMTSEEEKLAAVQALAAKGLDAKAASANRLTGMTERANGAIGDMMEQVGALLAPLRMVAAEGIAALAESIGRNLIPVVARVQDAFVVWGDSIRSVMERVINAGIALATALEVFWGNIGSVVSAGVDYVLLKYETYRADTEHLFVTTLPAYVEWFAENFYNILETAFNATAQLISDQISRIMDSMKALWDWIASAGSTDLLGSLGEIAGRSYLEGFQSSIGAMPDIAARALTDREQELRDRIGKTADNLAGQFRDKFNARAVSLGGKIAEDIERNIDLQLKKLGGPEQAGKNLLKLPGGSSGGGGGSLQATEGRLLTRGPGQGQDIMRQLAATMERAAKASERIASGQDSSESELRSINSSLNQTEALAFVTIA